MKKNSSKRVVIVLFIICCIITTGCISKEKGIDESSNTKQAINKKMKRSDIKDGKIINEAVMLTVGEKNVSFSEVIV